MQFPLTAIAIFCTLATLTLLTPIVSSADLVLVFKDESALIYFNETIDKSKTNWIFSLYSKSWKHVRKNFGIFGGQNGGRLKGMFQTTSGEGGMATSESAKDVSIYMDISPGGVREGNLYDKSSGAKQPKQEMLFEYQVGAISKIIEEGNNKILGSPAQSVWGSKGFRNMIIYDIFLNVGYKQEFEEWKKAKMNEKSDAATAKNQVYWLRDWWIPLYDKYGKTALLGRFFKLVADNWPKEGGTEKRYKGGMDVGQFVHFFSGAAKKDLKDHAAKALGWEQEDTDSLNKAKKDFPNVTKLY